MINTLLNNYSDLLMEIEDEMQHLPKGSLVKKNNCYYSSFEGKERGITHNKPLIHQLGRKKMLSLQKKASRIPFHTLRNSRN